MPLSPLNPPTVGAPYPETYQLPFFYTEWPTSQYQGATNFKQWLTVTLNVLDDLIQSLASFPSGFDLDSATGPRLDTLGAIIGQSRTVTFQPSNGVSPVLDDATYRLLLKARIAQNQWDGRMDSLQSIWQTLFPGGRLTIQDSQNMTATVIVSGVLTSIVEDLIVQGLIVPRPAGVLFNFSFGQLPLLGTDQQNSYIAGLDLGHFS